MKAEKITPYQWSTMYALDHDWYAMSPDSSTDKRGISRGKEHVIDGDLVFEYVSLKGRVNVYLREDNTCDILTCFGTKTGELPDGEWDNDVANDEITNVLHKRLDSIAVS